MSDIKLKIEGDRILTESGVKVGFDRSSYVRECEALSYSLKIGSYYATLEEAEAAFNAHLDAIGVVSRKELDAAEHRAHCDWRMDEAGVWQTGCGGAWEFTDGTPKQNHAYYCFRCGGQIVQYEAQGGA